VECCEAGLGLIIRGCVEGREVNGQALIKMRL
jgi:hypothetical protein